MTTFGYEKLAEALEYTGSLRICLTWRQSTIAWLESVPRIAHSQAYDPQPTSTLFQLTLSGGLCAPKPYFAGLEYYRAQPQAEQKNASAFKESQEK